MFACEFCAIFKQIFFEEHLWTTASAIVSNIVKQINSKDSCQRMHVRDETVHIRLWLLVHRGSHPEVFFEKVVLKICSKFTGEHPYRCVISIEMLCNFIEIALRHGCPPVNLLRLFRTPFSKNTSGRLLLSTSTQNCNSLLKAKLYWTNPRTPISQVALDYDSCFNDSSVI